MHCMIGVYAFNGRAIFLLDFLAHSKKMSYLCGRETISNDISDQFSTAKKY